MYGTATIYSKCMDRRPCRGSQSLEKDLSAWIDMLTARSRDTGYERYYLFVCLVIYAVLVNITLITITTNVGIVEP